MSNTSLRSLPLLRSPRERLGDWREIHTHVSDELLQDQASRCMDCGVPFCHTGAIINGAASGCPLNNLIPDWNQLVSEGDWREALIRLHQTNNFPEFTGRVCPAPCEGACVRALDERAVAIKSIECAIADRGLAEGWDMPKPPNRRTDWRIAIVGSGPAGLACAEQLNNVGHNVTVFERSDRVGGLLMYGIPNMKLDKGLVMRRTSRMADQGITFLVNTDVGRDYPADRLLVEFDAVVLCGGAAKPRDLKVVNRQLAGIHFAMEFLSSSTKALLDGSEPFITAKGKDVIVIGGGDTGTDCVATALRQGCNSLVQFEITPQPPNERAPENPWPQWPKIYRVEYGQEEAANRFGRDPREYLVMTEGFLADTSGKVRGVETTRAEWTATGPMPIMESRKQWPAQLVLLALGFGGPERTGLISQLGLRLNDRGAVEVDHNKMTDVPSVFAAGDIERGQSLVVWAIADGRKAAKGVDHFLGLSSQPAAALYASACHQF